MASSTLITVSRSSELKNRGQALACPDSDGRVLRRYVHGANTDEPLIWYEGAGFNRKRFLHADHQGSIVMVTDASIGALYNINTYDAYGNTNSSSVTAASRFAYTGQIYLAEIGLYYYKARVYNQKLGRFMQADPIGYRAGMNMYGYVGGDPVNYIDPFGLAETGGNCGRGEGDRHCGQTDTIGHRDGSQSCRGCMFGDTAQQFVSDYQSGFGQGAQGGQYGVCNGCVNPSWGPTDVVLGLYGVGSALANGARALTVAGVTKLLTMRNGFTVDPKKFNYFFGRVTSGNAHNIQRSDQNAKDLATLGVTSERQLMGVFRNALKNGFTVSIRTNNYGVSVTRSIAVGEQGAVNVSFFYAGGNMSVTPSVTTLIPKIYR